MEIKGKKITVLGIGISGREAARWLCGNGGIVTLSDMLPEKDWPEDIKKWCGTKGVMIEVGGHMEETIKTSDLVVVSPGVPSNAPPIKWAKAQGIPCLGEFALAVSLWKGPIIAITGTNGKTTTTKLLGAMMEKEGKRHVVAGNVGVPFISCMDQNSPETLAVLEVSSFQLDYIPFEGNFFNAAAWLNLSPDHLDRYEDFKAYGESKAKLFDLQGENGWAVINHDDPELIPWRKRGAARRLFFSASPLDRPGAWFQEEKGILHCVVDDNTREEYDLSKWQLKGVHNLENLAASVLLARVSGVGQKAVQSAIDTFRAPSHRLQFVLADKDLVFFDDSKATNVASSLMAIRALKEKIVLLAGGRGKGEDYSPLRVPAREGRLRAVVTLGEEAQAIGEVFSGIVPVIRINGSDEGQKIMKEAVSAAVFYAKKGDAVLLSPACASFDMFKNYEERGKAFQKAVREL